MTLFPCNTANLTPSYPNRLDAFSVSPMSSKRGKTSAKCPASFAAVYAYSIIVPLSTHREFVLYKVTSIR